MSRISRCFACQQYNCVCPTRDEAIEQLHNIGKGAHELLELLRDKWACPDTDAMTLYLASFLAGVAEQWLKNPPPNGFVHVSRFPGIGALQIDIRKLDGQSLAEAICQRDARIADLERQLAEANAWRAKLDGLAEVQDRLLVSVKAQLATAQAHIADLVDKLQTESHRLERERIAALEAERDAAVDETDKVWIEILVGVYDEIRAGATFENVCLEISARRHLRKLRGEDPIAAVRAGKAGE